MPIILPEGLPARHALEAEGVRAHRPDAAAPIRIVLFNLMPRKTDTEIQIARLLAGTPYTVELTLAIPDNYVSHTAPASHIGTFYKRWGAIRNASFDALIVTGAPIEHMPFEDVTYWPELTEVFDWAARKVHRSYYICWAAQAALYHFHGVPKHALPQKRFGVYRQTVLRPGHSLFDGLSGRFPVPVSRHTETRSEDLPRGLAVLAASPQSGLCMVEERNRRTLYMFNHLEYGAETLAEEYRRDREAGTGIDLPKHYFPRNDPSRMPVNRWRPYARRIFRNWLRDIERERKALHAASSAA